MPVYKDSATGKWYCKFYYKDYEGNKKQKKKMGFELKREAQEWERQFLEHTQAQPEMSFSSFLEFYKKDIYPQIRKSTIQRKEYRFKRIIPYFNDLAINSISTKDITRWQNKMIKKGFKTAYIRGLQTELSAVLNHAVKHYGLKENPCSKVGYAKVPDEMPSKMRFWTFEEYSKAIILINDIKAKTAINLLYWTGMRKGELYALTWEKFDFTNKTVTINRSLQRINGKDIITATKTYESRTIKLPDVTINQLKEYKSKCYNIDPEDLVFNWEKTFIEKGIKQGAELADVQRIHVHGLRHSHASYLISKGYNVVLVAKRLGHKDVTITLNTYSHFFPTDENNMIDDINKSTI